MSTPRTRPRKFLNEDISVHRIINDEGRVILIPQVIRAEYIRRIAESVEYKQATVLWIDGDEQPMTVDCEMGQFYEAWMAARINAQRNQST